MKNESMDSISMSPNELWRFFPLGYLFSILIETPILPSVCRRGNRSGAECSPESGSRPHLSIVVLVMPLAFPSASRTVYLIIAELLRGAECALFWLATASGTICKARCGATFGAIVYRHTSRHLIGGVDF